MATDVMDNGNVTTMDPADDQVVPTPENGSKPKKGGKKGTDRPFPGASDACSLSDVMIKINPEDVIRVDDAQCRIKLDPKAVDSYAMEMEAQGGYGTFPPIEAFQVAGHNKFVLSRGDHRLAAAKARNLDRVPALIHKGTVEDSFVYGIIDNLRGQVPLSREDKRRAVVRMLSMPTLKKSNREIAKLCGVSHPFVSIVKTELDEANNPKPSPPVPEPAQTNATPDPVGMPDPVQNGTATESTPDGGPVAPVATSAVPAVSDADYLASLPLSARLSGDPLTRFREEALSYREWADSPLYPQFQSEAKRIVSLRKPGVGDGPFSAILTKLSTMTHPRQWAMCGSCQGTGKQDGQDHKACAGRGFVR